MKNRLSIMSLVSLGALSFTAQAVNQSLYAKGTETNVTTSSKVAVSQNIRDIASPIRVVTKQRKLKLEQSGEKIPGVDINKQVRNIFPFASSLRTQDKVKDPSIQSILRPNLYSLAMPTTGVSFDGINNILGVAPPDTNGDVGPNHYVQAVNITMAIFDKEGNTLVAPFAINDLWDGFGGKCETNNDGDPIVLYDNMADRWLISQFALDGTDNHECIAISTTGDPTGSYYLYDFAYGELMNDYPHFGVWHDGYYMGVNQFDPTNNYSYAGGGVVAYERDKMLVGAEAKQIIFSMQGNTPDVFTPMPLDIDGPTSPNTNLNQTIMWADGSGESKLHFAEFDVDWETPENSNIIHKTSLDVAEWNAPDNAMQPNGIELDGMPIRSMFRAAYRNLGNRSSIVFTHNVAAADNSTPALRWYEIDLNETSGDVSVRQQGTFAPDEKARWMGSGAMDTQGNIAFGYSVSSADKHPSVFAATRKVDDPLNELTSEIELKAGTGSQGNIYRNRWGDYSSMSIDPADECTFWFTTEYYKAEDDNTTAWSTNISSFKLPECQVGPSGEISGKVTDGDTETALANVVVTAAGRSTVTDAEGNYSFTVPVGDYTLYAYKYGWEELTTAEFTVDEDESELLDVSLTSAEMVTVSGSVMDTSGQNWPLYAKVNVEVPGDVISTFTNPETGEYSIDLVAGTAVKVAVSSNEQGYLKASENITPVNSGGSSATFAQNFNLNINPNCTADGYELNELSFFEGFEGDVFPPAGWTTTDDATSGFTWFRATTERSISGITNESVGFALADSDAAGTINLDTSLISPVFNTADYTHFDLSFTAFHYYIGGDKVAVEIKIDDGSWITLSDLNKTTSSSTSAEQYHLDLSSYVVNATSFQLRWRYYDAYYAWYTAVDNIRIGSSTCDPISGNKVTAYVNDANFATTLNNAQLMVDGQPITVSVATEEDEQLSDGLLMSFIPDSATDIKLTAPLYESKDVVVSDFSLSSPIELNAGLLEVSTDAQTDFNITVGRDEERTLAVENTGTAGATYQVLMIPGSSEPLHVGVYDASGRHFGPKNLQDMDAKKSRYAADIKATQLPGGDIIGNFDLGLIYGWGLVMDRNTGNLWVSDIDADPQLLTEYQTDGNQTGRTILTPKEQGWGADLTFNGRTNSYWQVYVGGDNCIVEISEQGGLTGEKICPEFAQSQRGLAYDPMTDTYYSGSWNDSLIHQFNTNGELLRSINVNMAIAGLAFNSANGQLYVTHNAAAATGVFDIYVLDVNTDYLDIVGGFNVEDQNGTSLRGQAGLEIDCDGNLWTVDQTQQKVLGIATQSGGVCDWKIVPGLTLKGDHEGAIEAGESNDIQLTLKASELAVGEYEATIIVMNDTPYGVTNIPLSIVVTEAVVGELGFKETAASVKNGDAVELLIARTNGDDFAASVKYELVSNSAIAGEHFDAANGLVEWADKDATDKSVLIETINLDLDQDISFTVRLSDASGATLNDAAKDTSLITITADKLGVIAVKETNVSVNEEDGSAEITLSRTDGSDREVMVNYAVSHISTNDTDLADTTGTVAWADGDIEDKTISITINDDANVEADEAFNLVISATDSTIELGATVTAVRVLNTDKVEVKAKESSGGSLGFLSLVILSLFGLSRRKFMG